MSTDPRTTTLVDTSGEVRLETVRVEAWQGEAKSVVEMHRAIAMRLLREGSPVQAFQELVRATREVPMTARLAASLSMLALRAKTFGPALTLLTQGVDEVEGDERLAVMRHLARLARRAGEAERCREVLVQVLAEKPSDRRARGVLNGLLEQEQRWEELDGSLEKETREALRRGALRVASRIALRRAKLWDTRLDDFGRASLRYMQAAQYAEQAKDFERAFWLRSLWLRALHKSNAPPRSLADAAKATLAAGAKVGQAGRAQALVDELGLGLASAAVTGSDSGEKTAELLPEPRRQTTQLELVAIAEQAVKAGQKVEAAAVLSVAVREGPDPQAAQRLEALHVQRGAWRDLAELYRQLLARAKTGPERAQWGEKLAEVLETELHDGAGAAKAWAEVVAATGDPRAVAEQVRLLAEDKSGVRRALEAGIEKAQPGVERARALVLRAEEALTRRDQSAARLDFEAALHESPFHPQATAGLAELGAAEGKHEAVRALEVALARLPKHTRGRGDLYRRLARLADSPLGDAELGRAAWTEVVLELPDDQEASARLLNLSRASSDEVAVEEQLKALLGREPRGPKARAARLELVALYDRLGRGDDAVAALKDAIRMEPGHREAWLAYADRLEARGTRDEEVAWALEHAATATELPLERAKVWQRLATFAKARLRDEARAAAWSQRAQRLFAEHAPPVASPPPPVPVVLLGGPLVIPPKRMPKPLAGPPSPEELDALAATLQARPEPERPAGRHARIPPRTLTQLTPSPSEETPLPQTVELEVGDQLSRPDESVEELSSSDFVLSTAPEPPPIERAQTQELPASLALGDPEQAIAPSFMISPAKALSAERQTLFDRVRGDPLDPDGYRLLAEHFDTANDADRSSLMLEIARAIEGDPHAAPRTPRLILNVTDRAGLKHPLLRGESGELLSLVGQALCTLYPTTGRDAGSIDEFHLDAGKGAKASADSLLAAVRILGLRAPDVFLSEDAGPPFSLVVAANGPRVLVGRVAVKRELDPAELRFFAGRALFTMQPELAALRNLRREHVLRGLALVAEVSRGRVDSAEALVVREAIAPRSWERIRTLVTSVAPRLDVGRLQDGARHSANRAGLVVCGGVAPVITALRTKKALPSEMIELVRFAASERYLQLRGRVLSRR